MERKATARGMARLAKRVTPRTASGPALARDREQAPGAALAMGVARLCLWVSSFLAGCACLWRACKLCEHVNFFTWKEWIANFQPPSKQWCATARVDQPKSLALSNSLNFHALVSSLPLRYVVDDVPRARVRRYLVTVLSSQGAQSSRAAYNTIFSPALGPRGC